MPQFKRYIKNPFSIAGIRWTDGSDVELEDGILITRLNSQNASARSRIDDEAKLIKWENFLKKIAADLETTGAFNSVGSGTDLFVSTDTALNFRTLVEGSDIEITSTSDEITINTNYATIGAIQIPAIFDASAPSTPSQGQAYFSQNDQKVKVWNGSEWKTLQYEP